MREILFRAKDYRTGQWVYGIYFKNPVSRFNEGAYYPQIIPEIHGVHDTIERCSIVENTLGQYMGLTDKNGAKIFEGDMVEIDHQMVGTVAYQTGADDDYDNNTDNYTTGFIILWTRAPYLRQELGFWATKRDITIIGNIYDNSELLEGDNHE